MYISFAANTAFNMGSVLFNSSMYAKAASYLKRCIQYTFRNPTFNTSESEVNNFSFIKRNFLSPMFLSSILQVIDKLDRLFTYLYVSRKTDSDWINALEDFKMCLAACYTKDANGGTNCQSQTILLHILDTWIKFKRDIDSSRSFADKKDLIASVHL